MRGQVRFRADRVIAGLFAVPCLMTSTVQAQDAAYVATVGCDVPPGHVCYFTIFDEAAVPRANLTLASGEKQRVPVMDRQSYIYVVTLDRDFSTDPTCEQARGVGVLCKLESLKPGYND